MGLILRRVCALLGCLAAAALMADAEGPVLVRESGVASVATFQGVLPVQVTPVTAAPDVTVVVLSDTLASEDMPRMRRGFATLKSSFLSAHPLRIVTVSGTGGEASSRLESVAQIETALSRIAPGGGATGGASLFAILGEVARSLSGNWSNAIIVGRFPVPSSDSLWISGYIGEAFRNQRLRVSFWSLDGTAPAWTLNLSASTQGMVSTEDLRNLLVTVEDASTAFFEVKWQTKLAQGAHAYAADLKTATGERLLTVQTTASAPDFVLPLDSYLAARAAMAASSASETSAAQAVLTVNPSDIDALRRLKQWSRVSELLPNDAMAWTELANEAYSAGSYEKAEQALARARESGAGEDQLQQLDARLRVHRGDFQGALPLVEKALQSAQENQELWILRAECAQHLNRWSVQAESLERAGALGPLPIELRTALIAGYLSHGSPDRALPHLKSVTEQLPRDAVLHAQYASFWEQEKNEAAAEKLWKSALDADPKYEPAYFGLARHYLDQKLATEAMKIAAAGLSAAPDSMRLVLAKEDALEALGETRSARCFLKPYAAKCQEVELLRRRARLEDWHGGPDAAEAYARLMNAMIQASAPQSDVVATCRRGLEVAIRTERFDSAREFAQKLKGWGDPSGFELAGITRPAVPSTTELPGGADALAFLTMNQSKIKPERVLLEYSRALSLRAANADRKTFIEMQQLVRRYFEQVTALTALGTRKGNHVEVVLSLSDKASRQRTEKAFSILGLKLNKGKQGLTIASSEGKSGAEKQDTLAALAIDDQAIQTSFAAGKPYVLEIAIDRVPVFPAEDVWRSAFSLHAEHGGGLAEALVDDPRLPETYVALNSMDRRAADVLMAAIPLNTLANRYSTLLSELSAALAVNGTRAEAPGGRAADVVWTQLTGANPGNPAAFFQALLNRDDGRMIAFFYTLSQLDPLHQRFFTRSPERAKRFYDLFRDSAEMHRSAEHKLGATAFLEFLREAPLNDDGSVDFPGSPEIWMVAKGSAQSPGAMAKFSKKAKRVAADDEDAILLRLARTEYKGQNEHESELANFIAVTRIDAERSTPLSPESALELAQNYSAFGPLYPYFASLGDLEADDFSNLFSVERKIEAADVSAANIRSGELQSFLALLCLAQQTGLAKDGALRQVYRKAMERYSGAANSAEWTQASLTNVDDLLRATAGLNPASRDIAMQKLLIGEGEDLTIEVSGRAVTVNPVEQRRKAYQRMLQLQKVPPLDSLYAIRDAIPRLTVDPKSIEEIERELEKLPVLTPPKTWTGDSAFASKKKVLEQYETVEAQRIVVKIREKLARNKHDSREIQKLGTELLGHLEPWTELALAGQIYARYLDASDLIASDDAMLLRKHEFVELGQTGQRRTFLAASYFYSSSKGEGSYFTGGFAEFSMAAGLARAAGTHPAGPGAEAIAGALFGTIRATDWHSLNTASLEAFGADIRLAREWVVESAASEPMLQQLEQESLGLLSLTRRARLIDGIRHRDWPAVWESVTLSDLYFLGNSLIEHAPEALWKRPSLMAMKQTAAHAGALDVLGQVAPHLSGCAEPRLRRYEPYEEYQRYLMPDRIAERLAELKLYLAWEADSLAWPAEVLPAVANSAADAALGKLHMADFRNWTAALEAYHSLTPDQLEGLLEQQ